LADVQIIDSVCIYCYWHDRNARTQVALADNNNCNCLSDFDCKNRFQQKNIRIFLIYFHFLPSPTSQGIDRLFHAKFVAKWQHFAPKMPDKSCQSFLAGLT
jgi:hypothetical protein